MAIHQTIWWDNGAVKIDEYAFPGPLRDALVQAIISGEKTATTSLLDEYHAEGSELPRAGSVSWVVDSYGKPVAVTEVTRVDVLPLKEVLEELAVAEGEGFASVEQWRLAHEEFWSSPQFLAERGDAGFRIDDSTMVVCEYFRLLGVANPDAEQLSRMTLEQLWDLFPVELASYSDDYPRMFCEESALLCQLLDGQVRRINHIGSTAVPGLAAKPVVDILLETSMDFDEAIERLNAAGWLVMSRGESVVLNKGYTAEGLSTPAFHLHLRRFGDWDELYFRDYLRESAAARAEYAQLKTDLAARYLHDRDGYTAAKTSFVTEATAKARQRLNGLYVGAEDPIDVAAVVLGRSGAVLTVRKKGSQFFQLPGGKLESGETPIQAALRETSEETGLELAAGDLEFLGVFSAAAANEAGRRVRSHVFMAELPLTAPQVQAEIAEIRFTPLDASASRGDVAPLLKDRVFPALRGELG